MLMAEYAKLEHESTPKSTFTPEQQTDRINRNNNLSALGILGQMSGDQGVRGVGGQVFKQALGEQEPQRTKSGVFDPLTGATQLDPEYVDERRQNRQGRILERALMYQQSRQNSQDRAQSALQTTQLRTDAMRDAAASRAQTALMLRQMAAANQQNRPHNLVQITDATTGQMFWADPRDGSYVKPVEGAGGPLNKPDKLSGTDEKEITDLGKAKASAAAALAAVNAYPKAFGFMKGVPNLAGGTLGTVTQAIRDRRLGSDEVAARAMIFNNVSQIIKERAGTAQSAAEMRRLNSFLPSDLDGPDQIKAKVGALATYLDEQESSVRTKYNRPTAHMPGSLAGPGVGAPMPPAGPPVPGVTGAATTPATPAGIPRRLRFNPATGELE